MSLIFEPGGFGKTFSGVFDCCHVKIIPVFWLLTCELFGSANDLFFNGHASVCPLVISGFDPTSKRKDCLRQVNTSYTKQVVFDARP